MKDEEGLSERRGVVEDELGRTGDDEGESGATGNHLTNHKAEAIRIRLSRLVTRTSHRLRIMHD